MKKVSQNRLSNLFILISLISFIFQAINAADGDFDTTFNTTGFVKRTVGESFEQLDEIAIQADGKIVSVGTSGQEPTYSLITRHNTDGSLDTSFSSNGIVLLSSFPTVDIKSLAIQSDGKIVVVGSDAGSLTLLRYNSNGTIDTTFGLNGKATTNISDNISQNEAGNDVAIQADGKIVVACSTFLGTNFDFIIVRYNSDGSLDTTFNSDGIVITDFNGGWDSAHSLSIQSDGKIVVAGEGSEGANQKFAVARYNTNGSLDTTFSSDGWVLTQVGGGDADASAIAIQSDGKILVGGNQSIQQFFNIVRYNTNGTLDTTFDSDGIVTTFFGGAFCYELTVQTDGKILAVGDTGISTSFADREPTIIRYNTNGSLDATFSSDGILQVPLGTIASDFSSIKIQLDGKIVVGGIYFIFGDRDFSLARFNTNGTFDTSFDTDGVTSVSINPLDSNNVIAIQSTGKIIVGGTSTKEGNGDFALKSFSSTGQSVGADIKFPIGIRDDIARGIAIQSDDKILLVGSTRNGSNDDFAVCRAISGGFALDSSFNTSGKVVTPIGTSHDVATSVAVQSDGKIVVAGYSFNSTTNNNFAVVRYNSDGTLDTTFNSDGIATLDFDLGDDQANSIVIQSDGKIILVGYATNAGSIDFALARFNSNGTLDSTFGSGGKIATPIGSGTDIGKSTKIQLDGKILVGGSSSNGANTDFALARYKTNGFLDTSFSTDGKVTTPIGVGNDSANSIAIQLDGKIVAAGNANTDFAIARYNPDGTLDSTSFAENELNLFGTGGIVTSNFGTNDVANAVAIQSDGKIVVGGTSDNQVVVARYQNSLAPTASTASINGRVITSSGRGIRNVNLTLTNTITGETKYALTNAFGYYRFLELESGQSYVLSVKSKRYYFANPSRLITLNEDLTNEDFISDGK